VLGTHRRRHAKVGRAIIVCVAHSRSPRATDLCANDKPPGIAALLAIAQPSAHALPTAPSCASRLWREPSARLRILRCHPPTAVPLDRIVYDITLDMVAATAPSKAAVYSVGTFAAASDRDRQSAPDRSPRPCTSHRWSRRPLGPRRVLQGQRRPIVFLLDTHTSCYHQTCGHGPDKNRFLAPVRHRCFAG